MERRSMRVETHKRGVFYGWWIVMGATAAFALNGGLYFYGFGAFFDSLLREFGSSRAALSGVVSLSRLEHGLMGPVGGFLVDRLGPRRVMLIGIVLTGSGFILIGRVASLSSFYVVYVLLVAIGAGLGFSTPLLTAVGNWFIRKRSKAFGIALSGVGLGGFLVPPLRWAISQYGWRITAFGSGLVIWAVCIPVALLMRHRPERYGYLADGATEISMAGPGAEEPGFAAREALRTRAFWLLSAAFSLRVLVTGAIALHLMPFLLDIGFSWPMASGALGSVALISVAGRFGFGSLGDAFDKRYVMTALFVLMALSLWLLANTTQLWQVVAFLVLYAPAYGGLAVLMQATRGEYFGRQAFGTIMGFMSLVLMVGTISGPLFAGYVYDVAGSYRFAFMVFAALCLIALALILAAKPPAIPEGREAGERLVHSDNSY
jgi:MFS family permease